MPAWTSGAMHMPSGCGDPGQLDRNTRRRAGHCSGGPRDPALRGDARALGPWPCRGRRMHADSVACPGSLRLGARPGAPRGAPRRWTRTSADRSGWNADHSNENQHPSAPVRVVRDVGSRRHRPRNRRQSSALVRAERLGTVSAGTDRRARAERSGACNPPPQGARPTLPRRLPRPGPARRGRPHRARRRGAAGARCGCAGSSPSRAARGGHRASWR